MSSAPTHHLHQLVDRLQPEQVEALRQGQVIVTGQDGHYTAQVLVQASVEAAWAVLTDYDRFDQFLPTITSSEVLESRGDRNVVEQTDRRQVFLTDIKSRVRTENRENAEAQQIDFRLLDGDLDKMRGFWRIDAISPGSDTQGFPTVLITQKIEVEAGIGIFDGAFYKIFAESLQQNLQAIQAEMERRSQD